MTKTIKKPKISIVVTARNDNYGGNWINRINTFIKILVHLTNKYEELFELVFVEYNPVANKKRLYEELTIQNNKHLKVRFITVPNEFHKKLPRSSEVTVCEFIGKNIGIKRAKGEFILATNPDTIFSDELFKLITKKQLDNKNFYRVDRRDLYISKFDENLSVNDIYKICKKNITKVLFNNSTKYTSYKTWLNTFIHGRTFRIFSMCPLFNCWRKFQTKENIIHENTAGDFLLAPKSAWYDICGYDQMTVGSGVLDGYALYMMYCFEYTQKILKEPLYHIYHNHKGVKYLASHKKFREDANKMLKTKKPYKKPYQNWGFPEENFKEIVL
ncbi:hypothetical protein ACFLY7_00560 [Patescibacteria group bacterium]